MIPGDRDRLRSMPRTVLATVALAVSVAGPFAMSGGSPASGTVAPAPALESREPQQHQELRLPKDRATHSAGRDFVDLSSRVNISDGNCSFGPTLDRAIRGMIRFEGSPPIGRAARIELGGRYMTPVLTSMRDAGGARPDFLNYEASVRLSPAANWNGLRLTRLRLSTGWEWEARSLEFAESPTRVRAALRAMHIAISLPPGRRDIPTDACSVSIHIQTRPGGSALTCSGGC